MTLPEQRKSSLRKYLAEEFGAQAVALGNLTGMANAHILGYNPDVDMAQPHSNVWFTGGRYPYQTSGYQAEVVSDNVADTDGDPLGAHNVVLFGLDVNYVTVSEIVLLDGTTPVLSDRTDWLRINAVVVLDGVENLGQIDVTTTGGTPQATVLPLLGRSKNGLASIAADSIGVITQVSAGYQDAGAGTEVEFGLFQRERGRAWSQSAAWTIRSAGTSNYSQRFEAPLEIPPESDVEIRIMSVTSNNVEVLASFEGFLYDLDYHVPGA